jgi:hypothetical protein
LRTQEGRNVFHQFFGLGFLGIGQSGFHSGKEFLVDFLRGFASSGTFFRSRLITTGTTGSRPQSGRVCCPLGDGFLNLRLLGVGQFQCAERINGDCSTTCTTGKSTGCGIGTGSRRGGRIQTTCALEGHHIHLGHLIFGKDTFNSRTGFSGNLLLSFASSSLSSGIGGSRRRTGTATSSGGTRVGCTNRRSGVLEFLPSVSIDFQCVTGTSDCKNGR